jgi:hypothetical protein
MALWRDGVWQAILEVRAIAALPAIPLDDDTELSDIMEYLCEHFDASMDEHEVSRMSAMIREYASNVAKSRGALPVLETTDDETRIIKDDARYIEFLEMRRDYFKRKYLELKSASVPVLETPAEAVFCDHSQWRECAATLEMVRDLSDKALNYTAAYDLANDLAAILAGSDDAIPGALVEPVPAPTGIDPSELMRALHANLTPLAHVEVTDRRPYGMSEDTIQVWPITGVRSVVNHLALKSAPVPAPPKSRDMKAAEALWSDPAFLRRLADSMEDIQSGRDWHPVSIDELYEMLGVEKPEFQESAPVPAPRLEWRQISETLWKAGRWLVNDNYGWELQCYGFADIGDGTDAAVEQLKSLAEKIEVLLAPPVGTQE